MTFPLNSECSKHSLAHNINLRILDLPEEERPEPTKFFRALGRFVEVTQCQLGTFKELHQCSKNLRRQGENDKTVNGLLGDLLKKMEQVRSHWQANQSGPMPQNLVQSLKAANPKPKFTDVAEVLTEVFHVTTLNSGEINVWEREFGSIYPHETRSMEEIYAWSKLSYNFQELYSKDRDRAKALFSNYEKSNQLNELKCSIENQTCTKPEQKVIEILDSFGILRSNTKTQSKYLQQILSALWVEGNLGCAILRFVSELRAEFLSDETTSIWEILNIYRNLKGEITAFIDLDTKLYRRQLSSKFTTILAQAAEVEMSFENQRYESYIHRHQQLDKSTQQLKKLYAELPLTDNGVDDLEHQHRSRFQKLIKRQLDFIIFKLRAFVITGNTIGQYFRLRNGFDEEMKKKFLLATPFLNWSRIPIIEKLSVDFLQANLGIKFVDILADFFRAQLLYSQVISTQRVANSIIFNKLKNFVNHPNKKGTKISNRYLKNLVDENLPLAVRWPFDIEPEYEPKKIEILSSLTTHLNLTSWQSPINYAARVSRWFIAKLPLSKTQFPEYYRHDLQKQELSVHLHRMSPLLDYFYKRGVKDSQKHQDGSTRTRYLLPGEMNIDGVKHQGIIAWVFDADKVCFHRFFHVKLPDELMKNTVRRVFMETSLSQVPPDQLNPAGPMHITKLAIDQFEDCIAEIDELTNSATIKDTTCPDLGLTVQFLT